MYLIVCLPQSAKMTIKSYSVAKIEKSISDSKNDLV